MIGRNGVVKRDSAAKPFSVCSTVPALAVVVSITHSTIVPAVSVFFRAADLRLPENLAQDPLLPRPGPACPGHLSRQVRVVMAGPRFNRAHG